MSLAFAISPEVFAARKGELTTLLVQILPGCRASLDEMHSLLVVELPAGVDPTLAAETICNALAEQGIPAYLAEGGLPMYGTPMPPLPMPFSSAKPRRSVPLSVFVTSLIGVALAVCILTVFLSGAFSGGSLGNAWLGANDSTLGTGTQDGENYVNKIALIDRIFEEYSLYDTDGELLLDEMLKAYARATGDDYAAYYTDEEYAAMVADNNATVVGIGISAIEDSQHHDILVIEVLPSSPALEAGLQAGDRIVAIGTGDACVSVADVGYYAAVNLLRGEADTVAEFTVVRDGAELQFAITRAVVQTLSVTGRISETDRTVGHVRITQFDTATPVQFKNTILDLQEQGCTRFVFDVRNNPGGDLKSINAVLSYFLQENDTILSTVQKDGTTTVYRVRVVTYTGDYAGCSVTKDEIGMFRDIPAVVLTNGNTASAAELFTAALKDYGLAKVVGTATYGKGVLQNIYHLASWGYRGAVKLTVGYYSPPSGINYDGVGILPDTEVTLSEEAAKINLYLLTEQQDAQLQAAIAALDPS